MAEEMFTFSQEKRIRKHEEGEETVYSSCINRSRGESLIFNVQKRIRGTCLGACRGAKLDNSSVIPPGEKSAGEEPREGHTVFHE